MMQAPPVIVGHGVDLTPCARIGELLDRHADRFLERVFTETERGYADALPKRRLQHLAARFAAKEAAMKAIGAGWRDGIAWTDIETVNEPSGAPLLRVSGVFARRAEEAGVRRWLVSLSHTDDLAIASVLALGEAVS
jgi:holo-[acyl-carrier protein] synthase